MRPEDRAEPIKVDDLDLTRPPDVVTYFARLLAELGKLPVCASSANAAKPLYYVLTKAREEAREWEQAQQDRALGF